MRAWHDLIALVEVDGPSDLQQASPDDFGDDLEDEALLEDPEVQHVQSDSCPDSQNVMVRLRTTF